VYFNLQFWYDLEYWKILESGWPRTCLDPSPRSLWACARATPSWPVTARFEPSVAAHVHPATLSSSRSNRVSPRCTALLSLLLALLVPCCGPPLPPLLSTAALLLRHFGKLPPSSLCQRALRSRNLPQTVDRREELPDASRGRLPSASAGASPWTACLRF
jgi:hypothetical protein